MASKVEAHEDWLMELGKAAATLKKEVVALKLQVDELRSRGPIDIASMSVDDELPTKRVQLAAGSIVVIELTDDGECDGASSDAEMAHRRVRRLLIEMMTIQKARAIDDDEAY